MGVLCLVFVLLCITCVVSSFCNHLAGEEGAGCFTLIAFKCYVTASVKSPFFIIWGRGFFCSV